MSSTTSDAKAPLAAPIQAERALARLAVGNDRSTRERRESSGFGVLIHENYGRHRWGPPGGQVEEGETPWLAAVRETREEANVDVAVDHLVGLYLVTSDQPLLSFAFRCTIVAGAAMPGHAAEISEIGWFEANQLPSPLTNSGPYAIADAVRGERGVFREVPKLS